MVLTAAASLLEFWPLSWVLPFQWSDTCLAFVPQFEAPSESLIHSIPRSFLVESLSAYAVGFADALLLCPERAIGLVCRSRSQCRPSRAVSSLTVSVLCERSLLRKGRLPMRWVPSKPMGFAVAPPMSPYTGPGQSLRSYCTPMGAQVDVSYFSCATFRM